MTVVYHWTTHEKAKRILRDGLRAWSFVCREKNDWRGDVCLEINLPYDIDWEKRDKYHQWQAVVPNRIKPKDLKVSN